MEDSPRFTPLSMPEVYRYLGTWFSGGDGHRRDDAQSPHSHSTPATSPASTDAMLHPFSMMMTTPTVWSPSGRNGNRDADEATLLELLQPAASETTSPLNEPAWNGSSFDLLEELLGAPGLAS